MKRIRANGGARTDLQPEGIVILGQYPTHGLIAKALGVSVPGKGESVSVRLARAEMPGSGVAKIGKHLWRRATSADQPEPAPALPDLKKKEESASPENEEFW